MSQKPGDMIIHSRASGIRFFIRACVCIQKRRLENIYWSLDLEPSNLVGEIGGSFVA